jgi:hypothetical protein
MSSEFRAAADSGTAGGYAPRGRRIRGCRFFNFNPLKISRFKTGILNSNRKAGRVCLPALIL